MVPSMYSLIWAGESVTLPSNFSMVLSMYESLVGAAESVTLPSEKVQLNPHFEATLNQQGQSNDHPKWRLQKLTKKLVANIVFSDEISQELFIHTGLINDLSLQISVYIMGTYNKLLNPPRYPRMCSQVQWPLTIRVQLPRGLDGFPNHDWGP